MSHNYARVVECLKFVLHAQGAESYQMSNCLFKRCTVLNNKSNYTLSNLCITVISCSASIGKTEEVELLTVLKEKICGLFSTAVSEAVYTLSVSS